METFIAYWSEKLHLIWMFFVGVLIWLSGALISDFFTGIGDKLFGKKKEEPSDESH